MLDTNLRRSAAALLVFCVVRAVPAGAADVPVRYLVERLPLRNASPTVPLTIELHADPACSAPIASVALALQDVQRIVELKRVKLRGARSAPRVAELRHVVSGAPAVPAIYARISGDAIVPVAAACQVQQLAAPPAALRPIARDATGAPIGVLSVIAYQGQNSDLQPAVLRDDGHGVYGLAIGSMIFVSLEHGLTFPTADCTGTPFMRRMGVLGPTTLDENSGVIYGPGGPPANVALLSYLDVYGCQEIGPYTDFSVPLIPLDLERFVPPFRIDPAPAAP